MATLAVCVGTVAAPLSAAGDAPEAAPALGIRTVRVSVEGYGGNPPGPCTANCDAIRLTIAGFQARTTYHYRTNIVASDGSGAVSGSITTNRRGRATKHVAYYDRTVYDETYCVTVKRRQRCVDGR